MKVPRLFTAIAVALCAGSVGLAQRAPDADRDVERIAGAAVVRNGAYGFLQRLTDSIGGRVTGSDQSRAAADLLLDTLREAGLANAHFEEYALESRFEHGPALGRVMSPVDRPLAVGSYGWVPGTSGEVSAPLLDLGAPAGNELSVPGDRLRGTAVIVEPHALSGAPAQVMRAAVARALARAGAAAMLIPSDKPDRMLYTSAFGFYPAGPLPVLSIARADALLLRRLLASGPVRVGLNVANRLDTTPARERNVVAEIEGTTPETVLVGAHFDSWDPGQGALDDGVGVAAVLETARILKSLGIRPRRTIRFAFFSGEEQGLLGSRAYVSAHRDELDALSAVLIMDSGAQAPRGLMAQGRADVAAATRRLLTPLAALGASELSLEADFEQDHAPFLAAGVPAFTLWVAEGDYDTHHHAISDTFDKVDPRLLGLDTAVLAVAAYRLAEAAEPPGRRLSTSETTALLGRLGLESVRRLVYEAGESR
jgi:hypothetical protein